MSNNTLQGTVTFVHHNKSYITIAYEANQKKKTVNAIIHTKNTNEPSKQPNYKQRNYIVGDLVNFTLEPTTQGDKLTATKLQYLYNPQLDALLQRAVSHNRFIGYIKIVEDKYYIKEIDSYLFFALELSPWQIQFTPKELTEAVAFTLNNVAKKEKATAQLEKPNLLPAYYKAVQLHKNNTIIPAPVVKVTDYATYVEVVPNGIQAKVDVAPNTYALGAIVQVVISYITPIKIAVKMV